MKVSFPNLLPVPTTPLPLNNRAPEPFDEMKLGSAALDEKVDKLKSKGYFTIPMSRATLSYLKTQDQPGSQWKSTQDMKILSLKDESNYEQTATSIATEVASRFAQSTATLETQEFEIRRPAERDTAVEWHQDKQPKLLVCLATIAGKGTEFVPAEVAKNHFKPVTTLSGIAMGFDPKNSNLSINDVAKEAKKDRFYFFAARGVTSEHIPKLVHRAPPAAPEDTSDRSIFMARWRPHPRSNKAKF